MGEEPRLVLAKPTEQSFAAYLAFIDSFYTGMTGKPVPKGARLKSRSCGRTGGSSGTWKRSLLSARNHVAISHER